MTAAPATTRPRPELAAGWQLWPQAPLRSAGLPIEWMLDLARPGEDPGALLDRREFAAAMTWQNPTAASSWVHANLDPARRKLSGYRRGILARYGQRYCTKNDSIGFFGPIAWAQLDDAADAAIEVHGSAGIRRAQPSFEYWAIAALAQAWAADPALAPYVPVRIHPAATWAAGAARLPARSPLEVSAAQRAILTELADEPDGLAAGRFDPDVVDSLLNRGLLRRGFRLPVEANPQLRLRRLLRSIPDPMVRASYLGRLDRLDIVLAQLSEVWDEPEPLLVALECVDKVLAEIGGPREHRLGRAAETGRTAVYLDCRRDTDVVLGRPLLEPLREPLTLLLQSARWLTAQFAEVAHARLLRRYHELAARGPVTLADLHFAAGELLTGAEDAVAEVVADFRLRWQEIILPDAGCADAVEIEVPLARAAAMVAALFPAKAPGWAAARNHSPDLLLARTDAGHRWVLGELHVAMNTLESRALHDMCDDPEALLVESARDFATGRVVPCYPIGAGVDSRRYPPLASHVEGSYRYWSFTADEGPHPSARGSAAGTGLIVSLRRGVLHAGPEDGSWTLPVTEFLGEFLTALVVNQFVPVPVERYRPRVRLGELVVARRAWTLDASELPAGAVTKRGYCLEIVAAALARLGLPRQVFARVQFSPKPVYVDLQVPATLANLVRLWVAAGAQEGAARIVEVSEMLPAPDELWLTDPSGRHYTTEFRMVAVDPIPAAGFDERMGAPT